MQPRELLVLDAKGCTLCPRMENSRRVLSDLNGDWNAKVMFVAEAPGRLGAEITGIPLYGDRTGERFEQLLTAMRWKRSTIFLTNTVLCNPRNDKGNNAKPSRKEIRNCSTFLQRTIESINPILVVALGSVALDALRALLEHDCTVKDSFGRIVPWGTRYLGVLYHPSPLTQTWRKWNLQIEDAKSLSIVAETRLRIPRS
jgi:uracil-DNA glycosylase family 4